MPNLRRARGTSEPPAGFGWVAQWFCDVTVHLEIWPFSGSDPTDVRYFRRNMDKYGHSPASNRKLAKSLNALLRHETTELPGETLREARKCLMCDCISSPIRLRPLLRPVLSGGLGFDARRIESFSRDEWRRVEWCSYSIAGGDRRPLLCWWLGLARGPARGTVEPRAAHHMTHDQSEILSYVPVS